MSWPSLEGFLSLESPWLENPERIPVRDSKSKTYKHMTSCTSWKDFTHDNMRRHLEQYLAIEGDFRPPKIHPFCLCPENEKWVDNTFACWHQLIVNEALEAMFDKDSESLPSDRPIFQRIAITPGKTTAASGTDQLFPDWAGIIKNQWGQPQNVLPGDSKFTPVEFEEDDQRAEQSEAGAARRRSRVELESDYKFDCLGQICAYAYALNTRYAYLITNKQAIFVRISRPAHATPMKRITRNYAGENGITYPPFSQPLQITDEHKARLDNNRWNAYVSNSQVFQLPKIATSSQASDPLLPANGSVTPSKRAPTSPAQRTTPKARHNGETPTSALRPMPTSSPLAVRTPIKTPVSRSGAAAAHQTPTPSRPRFTSSPPVYHIPEQRSSPSAAPDSQRPLPSPPLPVYQDEETAPDAQPVITNYPAFINDVAPIQHPTSDSTYNLGDFPEFDLETAEVSVVPWHGREDGMTVLKGLVWMHYLASTDHEILHEYAPLGPDVRD